MQTDEVDGFLFDRGFQIFLTSYPEAKAMLDYKALDLQPFYAGTCSPKMMDYIYACLTLLGFNDV